MRELVGFEKLPEAIREQIRNITEIWKKHMGGDLVGVYLHGSIVLNAFCPESGDIDILVVVKNGISPEKRLEIAKDVISADQKPRPVEMSAIKLSDALNWVNDGNCVFHYSDYWTERYLRRFEDPKAEVCVVDQDFPDPDVTGYIRVIKEHGIVLYGAPVNEVLSDISDEDFWRSLTSEIDDYEFGNLNPRYFASNILILGRILSFKVEKRILSKYEAGKWMTDYVPPELEYLPKAAMAVWFDGEEKDFPEEDLERLKAFLIGEIKKHQAR